VVSDEASRAIYLALCVQNSMPGVLSATLPLSDYGMVARDLTGILICNSDSELKGLLATVWISSGSTGERTLHFQELVLTIDPKDASAVTQSQGVDGDLELGGGIVP